MANFKHFLTSSNATASEAEFVIKSVENSMRTIKAECDSLDMQIATLTAQRLAKQKELDAAMGIAAKIEVKFPVAPLPVIPEGYDVNGPKMEPGQPMPTRF